MQKLGWIFAFFALTLLPGLGACADQPAVLDRPAQLLIADDLLTLWSLGLTEDGKQSQMDLSRNALLFLVLSDEVNNVLYRGSNPALFRRAPQVYDSYVKKELVEQVAARVFGQKLQQHYAPGGAMYNGKGYFFEARALGRPDASFAGLDSDDLLPGFAEFEVVEQQADGSWMLIGRMHRFKMAGDTEIVWREATVQAEVFWDGQNWAIRTFVLANEAMG